MIPITTPIVRTLRIIITLLLVSSGLVAAACFYPDGSVAQDTPCTDSTSESTCCGTGYACLGHESSFFLCQATGEEFQKPGASQYVRGSCTDKSWRSSNCPNVCVDPDRDNTAGGHGVAPCPRSDILFYCISEGLGVENCSTGFNLIDFFASPSLLTTVGVIPSPTSSSTSTSSSRLSTTRPADTSSTASAGNTKETNPPLGTSSSSPSSNGTTIGIAVGVSIGVLGLLAAGAFAWLLMRKKAKQAQAGGGQAIINHNSNPNNVMATTTGDQNYGPTPTYAESYKQGGLGTEPHASYVYIPAPLEAPANEHIARYELPGGGVDSGSPELGSQLRGG